MIRTGDLQNTQQKFKYSRLTFGLQIEWYMTTGNSGCQEVTESFIRVIIYFIMYASCFRQSGVAHTRTAGACDPPACFHSAYGHIWELHTHTHTQIYIYIYNNKYTIIQAVRYTTCSDFDTVRPANQTTKMAVALCQIKGWRHMIYQLLEAH